ncbi:hypothetical protein R3J32_04670 [Xylella fastidiosa subsp. multiplex]
MIVNIILPCVARFAQCPRGRSSTWMIGALVALVAHAVLAWSERS